MIKDISICIIHEASYYEKFHKQHYKIVKSLKVLAQPITLCTSLDVIVTIFFLFSI